MKYGGVSPPHADRVREKIFGFCVCVCVKMSYFGEFWHYFE